jgi:hypothetical protein
MSVQPYLAEIINQFSRQSPRPAARHQVPMEDLQGGHRLNRGEVRLAFRRRVRHSIASG